MTTTQTSDRQTESAEAERHRDHAGRPEHDSFSFQQFQRIDDINEWLGRLAAAHAPAAQVVDGGRSFEGRPIRGLRLFPGPDKPRVLIEAGMHAQEWITTSSACWIVHQLLRGCGTPGTTPGTGSKPTSPASWRQRAAEHFEWHVFPNVNPDGYEYSFITNRSWRKTRSKGLVCFGVDGNRNWPYGWTPGSSTTRHPCARNFPGRAPLSEPETRALADYVRALRPSLKVYVSLHSSKQMILFPWGCCTEPSADHDELMEIGTRAANALERVHGTKFVVGPISTTIYMAPGNSVDWAYSIGIKYAFAMELRNPVPAERYVRASAIVDTGEETFEAIITILGEVAGRLGSGGQPSGQPQQRAPRPQRPRAPKPSRRRKQDSKGCLLEVNSPREVLHLESLCLSKKTTVPDGSTNVTVG